MTLNLKKFFFFPLSFAPHRPFLARRWCFEICIWQLGERGKKWLNDFLSWLLGVLVLVVVVVVGFSIPHTTPGLRIGQEKTGAG